MNEKLIYGDETYALRGAIFEVCKTLGDGWPWHGNRLRDGSCDDCRFGELRTPLQR